MIEECIVGGVIGVSLPIGVDYVSKGYKIAQLRNIRLSGLIGVVAGAASIITALGEEYGWWTPIGLTTDQKAALASFGGSSLATGSIILILDYAKAKVPMKKEGTRYVPPPARGLQEKVAEEEEIIVA